jgi:DNA-binding transcriptional LysR family regulator
MEPSSQFDMNLLRVFDALERCGHVGRAAEELDLSQPSVSYALKRLRQMLDDPLFVKARNGIAPTPRTLHLIPVVRSILSDVTEHILPAPRFEPETTKRRFTLAMSDMDEMIFLPRLIERMAEQAPLVDIRTVSIDPKALVLALQRREVDLAVGYFPDLEGADVFQQRLFDHDFACLARIGHPAIPGRLTRKTFCDVPHAVLQVEGRIHEVVEQFLNSHGVQRRVLLRCAHFLSIPMIVASTDLLVTIPAAVAQVLTRMAPVQSLEPPYPIPGFSLQQHWHRCQHRDPGIRWLRDNMIKLFADLRVAARERAIVPLSAAATGP